MVRLSIEDIFPFAEVNPIMYMDGISRRKLINLSALLISVSTKSNSWQDHEVFLLNKWFSIANRELGKEIHDSIKNLEATRLKPFRAKFKIIDKVVALKFLEYVLSKETYPDTDLISNEAVEVNILKCILSLNSIENS